MEYLIRIETRTWVAGAVCIGNDVMRCAPILAWSKRAGARKLATWARNKGFTVTYHDREITNAELDRRS